MICYCIRCSIGDLCFPSPLRVIFIFNRRDIFVSHAELYIVYRLGMSCRDDTPRNDSIAADLYSVRLYLSLSEGTDSLDIRRRTVDEAVS